MTTAELFSRLLSRATVRDPARVPFDDTVEIVGAMNSALSEYYDLAPARFSNTTISKVLAAPETLVVSATNGSATVSTFSASQRGATVVIYDDPGQNEVVSTSSVLDAYQGTSGTVSATVYGDAIVILDSSYKRVISHPRLNDGTELRPDDGLLRGRFSGLRSTGKPYRYCLEYSGKAAGGRDVTILRVDPMPTRSYIVRMEVEVNPLKIVTDDLSSPVDLPVPSHMEQHLISLCRWHLKGLSLFPDKPDTDEKAQAGRFAIENQSPTAGRSHGKVGTPRGY